MNSHASAISKDGGNANSPDASHFEVDEAFTAAIIAKRTMALEAQDKFRAKIAEAVTVCIFALGDERFALTVAAIEAVINSRPLGAVPVADRRILGSLFERGETWIVYSLSALLGGSSEPAPAAGRLFLLHGDVRRAAIFVDRVDEIARIDPSHFASVSKSEMPAGDKLVVGAAPDGLMLLDAGLLWSIISETQRNGKWC